MMRVIDGTQRTNERKEKKGKERLEKEEKGISDSGC